jgi:HSP20 family protein
MSVEREMQGLMRRFGRLLGESEPFAWRVAADMYREGDSLVIKAEVPGIDPEKDLEISVENNLLYIRGEKSMETEVQSENRYLRERSFGRFERHIALPDGVDPDRVAASYDKGVLTVRVPVPAEPVSVIKRIPIKTV